MMVKKLGIRLRDPAPWLQLVIKTIDSDTGYSDTLKNLLLTVTLFYRVTHQVGPDLLLTLRWRLRFSICSFN